MQSLQQLFNKKGNVGLNNLGSIIMVLGVTAVIMVVFGVLMNSLKANTGATIYGEGDYGNSTSTATAAYNVTIAGTKFLGNTSSQFGLLGTIIGLVLVVSVVLGVFRSGKGSGGGGI